MDYSGSDVALMVNGSGGTPLMELYLINNHVNDVLTAKGFAAVEAKLDSLRDQNVGAVLKAVGMTLVSAVGGSSGPLFGTAFMKAGIVMADKDNDGRCFDRYGRRNG